MFTYYQKRYNKTMTDLSPTRSDKILSAAHLAASAANDFSHCRSHFDQLKNATGESAEHHTEHLDKHLELGTDHLTRLIEYLCALLPGIEENMADIYKNSADKPGELLKKMSGK